MDEVEGVIIHDGQGKPHPREIRVTLNGHPVVLSDRRLTGHEIKQAAIAQHVPIQPDFVLFVVRPNDKLKAVGDDEEITLHEGAELRAVAPDDNS